jgi:hypothetical protein
MLAAGACVLRAVPATSASGCVMTAQDPDMMKVVSGLFNSDKMLTWQLQVGRQSFWFTLCNNAGCLRW